MDAFLDEVADIAEEVSAEQRQVAREVRSLKRARQRGASWADMADRQAVGYGPLGRLRESRRKLAKAAGRLAQGVAEGLRAEGQSYRMIAARLGVTHQRVSAMLTRRSASSDPRR